MLLGALLVLAVVSLTAAAGLLLASAAASVSAAHRASVEADLAAGAGLHQFLAGAVGTPPALRTVVVPGGPALVESERLVEAVDGRPVFRIRSRAPWSAGGASALREVEVLAVPVPPVGPLPAAVASPGAVVGGNPDALLSGFDRAPEEGCAAAPTDVAGVSVPAGGAAALTAGVVEGAPPRLESARPTSPAVSDGPALVAGLASLGGAASGLRVVPDGSALGSAASGGGLLVATGDLDLEDGFRWDGLVVVAGALSLRGAPSIRGGVLAGLGASAGSPPPDPAVDLGNGAAQIAYDRCAVRAAVLEVSVLGAVPGSWREAF